MPGPDLGRRASRSAAGTAWPMLGLVVAGAALLIAMAAGHLTIAAALALWTATALLAAAALTLAERRRRAAARELDESRARLARAQRMETVGRLAGGIAHDINNYLATIRAHSQLVRSHDLEPSEVRRKMDLIETTVLKSSSLVERLLAYARRQPTRPQALDVNDVVRGLDKVLRATVGSDRSLELRLQPDLWPVEIDQAQLEQLVTNLLVNARDATGAGGRIVVETRNLSGAGSGDAVRLAVSDDGCGIPAELQQRVFDPFFTTKEGVGGSGLGLAAVDAIATQARATIDLSSRPGEGTTLRIDFPRHRAKRSAARARRTGRAAPPAGGDETILVVDDNEGLAEAVRSQLEDLGYSVLSAASPSLALTAADAARQIDLVITDVQLPEMSGPELVRALRRKIPVRVLFMSGYTERIAWREGPGRGEAFFLKKPFSAQGLARMVRELLDEPVPKSAASPRDLGAAPSLAALALLGALAATPAAAQTPLSLDAFGLLVALQSRPSFAIVGAGARAAGMGGAFTALADDASAASFNPAGLALLVTPETSVVFDRLHRSADHAAFLALEDSGPERFSDSSSAFETTSLNFASFTHPFTVGGRNLSLQLSFHRSIDFDFESRRRLFEGDDPRSPTAVLRQTIDQSGAVQTLSAAAAYQLTPRMSLGLNLARWIGDWTFSTLTEETDSGADETDSLRFRQDNRWRGWSWTFGTLLRYRYLNVGLSYRLPFTGDFEVDSSLAASFDTPFESEASSDASLKWPSSWTLGLAFKPLQTWFVTIDYSQFDWDDMLIRGLGEAGAEPLNFFDLRPTSQSTVSHSDQWRLGTEYTVFAGRSVMGLRAGWFDLPRPQIAGPSGEHTSLRGWSVGVGWKRGPVSIDIAWQRGSATRATLEFVDPEIVATGQVAAQAEGSIDLVEERLFLSVLYRFGDAADLRDLFRFVFVGPTKKASPQEGG